MTHSGEAGRRPAHRHHFRSAVSRVLPPLGTIMPRTEGSPVRSLRTGRRLAAIVAGAVLAAAAAVGPASPAAATTTETYLAGVAGVGDVAAGAGKVYVAALDRVVVADSSAAVTGAVTGLSGAEGLALTPDGSRLFVALSGSREVVEIDTGTLQIVRRVDLGPYPCPTNLSLAGNRLWVGYGCYGQWNGGIVTLDVAEPAPAVAPLNSGTYYSAPLIAAAGTVLVAGTPGISPATVEVYAVDGASATLRGTITGDASNLGDLAVTPDGAMVVTASGYPYSHVGYDTTTLTEVRRYGDPSWGYPLAVAISPDGAYLAAGRNGHPRLSFHTVANAATLGQADSGTGDLVARAVTFLGPDVFGILNDWQAGRFYLWRVAGATLAHSAIALAPPASATAGEPMSITGRLTLTDGAAPGAQQLTATRTLPDGTRTTLAPVTTAADGAFTLTDTPPVAGDIRYDVAWAGNSTYQGSDASLTVPVARRAATLTLTGPTTGEAGKRLRLSGTLTLDGSAPNPPATLAVYRAITNNHEGGWPERLDDVVTDSRGGFRIDDTPTQGGSYAYTVRWAGSEVYGPAEATHTVSVTSTASQLTGGMEQPAYVGESYYVAGGVSFDVGYCAGPTTIHVKRKIGSGPVEARPDVTTDEWCSFRFDETLTVPGSVAYTLTWDGDATHRGSTLTVSGTVQKQPSYIQAWARDHYLRSGEQAVFDGLVAGSRTGPLGIRLTVQVKRTDPAGNTVQLRDITTATDGTFVLRDGPLRWAEGYNTAFVYEFSWAGNATYAGSSTTDTIYITPLG
jgi:YVTN family beta-propeller protein